jgi:hypothetical protein
MEKNLIKTGIVKRSSKIAGQQQKKTYITG